MNNMICEIIHNNSLEQQKVIYTTLTLFKRLHDWHLGVMLCQVVSSRVGNISNLV